MSKAKSALMSKAKSALTSKAKSIKSKQPEIIYNLNHLKTKNQNKAIVFLITIMVILVFLVLVLPSIIARAEDSTQNIILGSINGVFSGISNVIRSIPSLFEMIF